MSDAYASRIISGKIKGPKTSIVYKLAHAMGISIDALLDRAESYDEDKE